MTEASHTVALIALRHNLTSKFDALHIVEICFMRQAQIWVSCMFGTSRIGGPLQNLSSGASCGGKGTASVLKRSRRHTPFVHILGAIG